MEVDEIVGVFNVVVLFFVSVFEPVSYTHLPWLFKQIERKLKGEDVLEVTPAEKIDMCLRHYELAIKNDGEFKAVREMRKHASWYIKGLPKSSEIRNIMNTMDSSEEVFKILNEYTKELSNILYE